MEEIIKKNDEKVQEIILSKDQNRYKEKGIIRIKEKFKIQYKK